MVETFVGDDAMSPPPLLWANLPDDDGDDIPRTTNGVEAFHSNFNRQFKSARPNMYALAHKLIQLQEQNYVTLQTVQKCAEI